MIHTLRLQSPKRLWLRERMSRVNSCGLTPRRSDPKVYRLVSNTCFSGSKTKKEACCAPSSGAVGCSQLKKHPQGVESPKGGFERSPSLSRPARWARAWLLPVCPRGNSTPKQNAGKIPISFASHGDSMVGTVESGDIRKVRHTWVPTGLAGTWPSTPG